MSSAGTSQVADWSSRSAWDSLSTTSRTEACAEAATVIAASAQASVRDVVDNESQADLLLQSATWDVPAELISGGTTLGGLQRVDPLRVAYSTAVAGEVTPAVGAPVGFFDAPLTVPVVD